MPKYFFNVRDAKGETRDSEGLDFPDPASAAAEALRAAREILGSKLSVGVEPTWIDMGRVIDVTDESGAVVHSQRFSEVTHHLRHPLR